MEGKLVLALESTVAGSRCWAPISPCLESCTGREGVLLTPFLRYLCGQQPKHMVGCKKQKKMQKKLSQMHRTWIFLKIAHKVYRL